MDPPNQPPAFWSRYATLLVAEIGRIQLFSSFHALLGSEYPY
jgi:hypothetical protein